MVKGRDNLKCLLKVGYNDNGAFQFRSPFNFSMN